MDHNNRSDLEVHSADANPLLPQLLEHVSGMLVKWQELPFCEKIKKSNEAIVICHLPVDISIAANEPQPTSRLLFHCDCSSRDLF